MIKKFACDLTYNQGHEFFATQRTSSLCSIQRDWNLDRPRTGWMVSYQNRLQWRYFGCKEYMIHNMGKAQWGGLHQLHRPIGLGTLERRIHGNSPKFRNSHCGLQGKVLQISGGYQYLVDCTRWIHGRDGSLCELGSRSFADSTAVPNCKIRPRLFEKWNGRGLWSVPQDQGGYQCVSIPFNQARTSWGPRRDDEHWLKKVTTRLVSNRWLKIFK